MINLLSSTVEYGNSNYIARILTIKCKKKIKYTPFIISEKNPYGYEGFNFFLFTVCISRLICEFITKSSKYILEIPNFTLNSTNLVIDL